ncbi:MAG: glutamine synthetase III [Kiritimatiellae bacterium]|jgi:glutamine synthetase|nr:glutamine synthetase III [Kiritimatiellia bacterium]
MKEILKTFGENLFSLKTMKEIVSSDVYESLVATIYAGKALDSSIAGEVAQAMKDWAIDNGATHYTHWFQPLTGSTAEKHDSFLKPDGKGGAIAQFKASELSMGEPDASSFPSGGLRATFEARGYTAWDPTSPAFLKKVDGVVTLCIPTIFCGYNGEALDMKTPLLRSINVLSEQVCRLGEYFGIDSTDKRASATLGCEQEYFLIDHSFYVERLDLLQTGRTLFGNTPAKHQQLDDHYFGAIKSRILVFMSEVDRELWKLGVPAQTRHNEVCPSQFEIAPLFEELNLAVDHNMIIMEVLRSVAERHGFACLLHEKPFAGVNGSGKHNNWSVTGTDGKNWLTPGDDPHENAKFLAMICALMKAVDTWAPLLRSSVATAGNDHRLGANEAPPAIISIFLGEQLFDVIEQIEKGKAESSKSGGQIAIGISSLPPMPRDATDRNRTSPFAFTGNKFEFRAPGSSQNTSAVNFILNTIVADALEEMCDEIDAAIADGVDFNAALQTCLHEIVKKHKRILFNGDNYTQEWQDEAAKRGLPNLRTTPEALASLVDEDSIALFEKYSILTRAELESRYEVHMEAYRMAIRIEADTAVTMARTLLPLPVIEFQKELATGIKASEEYGCEMKEGKLLLQEISREFENLMAKTKVLENTSIINTEETIAAMNDLRETVDRLEHLTPKELWPLPSYAEMMFMI